MHSSYLVFKIDSSEYLGKKRKEFLGNTLENALNNIHREDIVQKCIFNVEVVTDDAEKAVARVRLDQPNSETINQEIKSSSIKKDFIIEDSDKNKVCIL